MSFSVSTDAIINMWPPAPQSLVPPLGSYSVPRRKTSSTSSSEPYATPARASEMPTCAGHGGLCWSCGCQVQTLQGGLLNLLDEEFPLVLRGLAILGTHDAGGPVEVEHIDQLLLLVLQFLNLSFQLSVYRLQLLRLL